MNSWLVKKLGEMISHKKGFAFRSEWFQTSGVPVVKVTNFSDSSVDTRDLVYVNKKIADEKKDYILNGGDVVIQTVGSWPNNPESVVGKVIRIPSALNNSLLNQNAVIFRPKDGLCGDYLFYLLKDKNFKGYIINTAQGAANQASITLDSIFRFEFYIPPFEVQRRIAAILSAYENLIENNKRRIALLENMAEEIYREWFVRMRFPEYENVKFVKGVPEDWRNSPSIEVFDVLSGGTPKTNIPAYWDGDIPFFTPKDAKDNFYVLNTEKSITANGLRNCNSRLYRKNTIFITARGTVGKLVLAQRDMAMNQSCYALLPKAEGGIYFYFLSLNNAIMYIKGISKSGVFDNIIVDTFKVIPIVMPSKPVIDTFNSKVGPLFEQISCLSDKNEILRTSRDMLLGHLISGKLPVEFLDIQSPPSIQTEQDAAHA
jgi:type I restriction enzyme S subunit